MVTGDHPITAKAISKKVGIIWSDDEDDIAEENAAKGDFNKIDFKDFERSNESN